MLRYFNFEPSLKLRWCRARDLFTDFFVGIISSTKNFKKLPLVESFFNVTQEKETTQKGNNVLKFCKLQKIFAKLSLYL